MKNVVEIWNAVLEIIKPEFDIMVSYNTWIEPVIPVDIDDKRILLKVPLPYHKDFIQKRYLSLIKNALIFITDKDYEIEIIVDGEHEKKSVPSDSHLNSSYIFDNFVIGKSNQYAHATALAIAEGKGNLFNPFFLYGGVGLGKTHLMHAIGNFMLSQAPNKKVLYVSSEQFTNDMITAIKNGTNHEFREKYRTLDLLLVDDIQFIWDKEATQEEFFHTFNELYQQGKHIIITSDRHPRDLKSFMDRLRNRFEQGAVVDIIPPDYETRLAILEKKAHQLKIDIPKDVYEFVASKIKSNIRELEGAIKKILLFHQLAKREINIDLAKEALKDILTEKKRKITPELVIERVEKQFTLKDGDLKSKNRSQNIAFPRQIAMYILKEYTSLSLNSIADIFGLKDHTTVMHGLKKVKNQLSVDPSLDNLINDLVKDLRD